VSAASASRAPGPGPVIEAEAAAARAPLPAPAVTLTAADRARFATLPVSPGQSPVFLFHQVCPYACGPEATYGVTQTELMRMLLAVRSAGYTTISIFSAPSTTPSHEAPRFTIYRTTTAELLYDWLARHASAKL
jgi:hypothetical protein